MRAVVGLGMFSAALALGALGWVGCGGNTTESENNAANTSRDSGVTDAVSAVNPTPGDPKKPKSDGGTSTGNTNGGEEDAAAAEDPCVPGPNLSEVEVPDAAIGTGSASTGQCMACTKNKCGGALSACSDDCDCNSSIRGLFECLGGGGDLQTCGGALLGAGSLGQALGVCVYTNCQAQCGIPNLTGGGGSDAGAAPTPADAH